MLKLIKYEYRKDLPTYSVLLGLLVFIEVYFAISVLMENGTHAAIATILYIMCGFSGVLALMLLGAISYSKELNSKYSYMTFMTPNKPEKIVGAKYISLFIATAVSSILYIGLTVFNYWLITKQYTSVRVFREMMESMARSMGYESDKYFGMFAAILVTIWLGLFFSVSCAYMAITLSTTVLANKKGKGWLSVLFFFIIYFVIQKIASHIPKIDADYTVWGMIKANILVYLFELLAILGTYFFVTWMLKKKISL